LSQKCGGDLINLYKKLWKKKRRKGGILDEKKMREK